MKNIAKNNNYDEKQIIQLQMKSEEKGIFKVDLQIVIKKLTQKIYLKLCGMEKLFNIFIVRLYEEFILRSIHKKNKIKSDVSYQLQKTPQFFYFSKN